MDSMRGCRSRGYLIKHITTALTGPPSNDYDLKTRVIGGSRSPLG